MKNLKINSGSLKVFFIALWLIIGSLYVIPAEAQTKYNQNKLIKRACKIFEKNRYKEYRKALAAMNRKPQPRAEVNTSQRQLSSNTRAKLVRYNTTTVATLSRRPRGE